MEDFVWTIDLVDSQRSVQSGTCTLMSCSCRYQDYYLGMYERVTIIIALFLLWSQVILCQSLQVYHFGSRVETFLFPKFAVSEKKTIWTFCSSVFEQMVRNVFTSVKANLEGCILLSLQWAGLNAYICSGYIKLFIRSFKLRFNIKCLCARLSFSHFLERF